MQEILVGYFADPRTAALAAAMYTEHKDVDKVRRMLRLVDAKMDETH